MKVITISSTDNIHNGYGNITYELCSFLKDYVDLTLLLPREELKYSGRTYRTEYVLPEYVFNLKTLRILEYLTFSYPEAKNTDIIHSLFEFPHALIAARLARKYKKPLIVGTQGTYAVKPLFMWPEKYFVKHIYNTAKVITAASNFTREKIIEFSGTKTPVQVIHNGVNFERFQKEYNLNDLRSKYGSKKILLTVGGLKPRKGQDIVIRALGLLKKMRNDDFHYICIGSGKFLNRLKEIAVKEGVENDVSFLGEMDGENLVKHYHLCDIYVHTPRLVDWNFEGFGIVYLEASACGKPIVAADAGGIRDAVLDGKTGLVIPKDDPVATAEAINKLFNSRNLAMQMGEAGCEYARENDWSNIGRKFLDLYQKPH